MCGVVCDTVRAVCASVVWCVIWHMRCEFVWCGCDMVPAMHVGGVHVWHVRWRGAGVTAVQGGQKPTECTRTCLCSSNRRKGRAPLEPLWGSPLAQAGQPDGGR